jgi:hypothetical protein
MSVERMVKGLLHQVHLDNNIFIVICVAKQKRGTIGTTVTLGGRFG